MADRFTRSMGTLSLGTRPSHAEEEEGLVNLHTYKFEAAEFRRDESDWLMTV